MQILILAVINHLALAIRDIDVQLKELERKFAWHWARRCEKADKERKRILANFKKSKKVFFLIRRVCLFYRSFVHSYIKPVMPVDLGSGRISVDIFSVFFISQMSFDIVCSRLLLVVLQFSWSNECLRMPNLWMYMGEKIVFVASYFSQYPHYWTAKHR